MQITGSYASLAAVSLRTDNLRNPGEVKAPQASPPVDIPTPEADTPAFGQAEGAEPKFPYYDMLGRPRDMDGRLVDDQGRLLENQEPQPVENEAGEFWENPKPELQLFPAHLISREEVLAHVARLKEYQELYEAVIKPSMNANAADAAYMQQMEDGRVAGDMPKAVEWLNSTASLYNEFKRRSESEEYKTNAAFKEQVDSWLANSKKMVTNAYQAIASQTQPSGPILLWNEDGTLEVPNFTLSLRGQTILSHSAEPSRE